MTGRMSFEKEGKIERTFVMNDAKVKRFLPEEAGSPNGEDVLPEE